jgi:hypothetical protein
MPFASGLAGRQTNTRPVSVPRNAWHSVDSSLRPSPPAAHGALAVRHRFATLRPGPCTFCDCGEVSAGLRRSEYGDLPLLL